MGYKDVWFIGPAVSDGDVWPSGQLWFTKMFSSLGQLRETESHTCGASSHCSVLSARVQLVANADLL